MKTKTPTDEQVTRALDDVLDVMAPHMTYTFAAPVAAEGRLTNWTEASRAELLAALCSGREFDTLWYAPVVTTSELLVWGRICRVGSRIHVCARVCGRNYRDHAEEVIVDADDEAPAEVMLAKIADQIVNAASAVFAREEEASS